MKRNRILAIGIALLLAVQLLTPLACAAGTTLKLTAPDKLPDVGQTFTVTAELTGNTGLAAVPASVWATTIPLSNAPALKTGRSLPVCSPRATRTQRVTASARSSQRRPPPPSRPMAASPCLPSASRRRRREADPCRCAPVRHGRQGRSRFPIRSRR